MNTLNTIIEEEKINARAFMSPHRPYTTEMKKMVGKWEEHLDTVITTAMQRAYEAGQAERDTYWKERVRKEVYEKSWDESGKGDRLIEVSTVYTLLDNLK